MVNVARIRQWRGIGRHLCSRAARRVALPGGVALGWAMVVTCAFWWQVGTPVVAAESGGAQLWVLDRISHERRQVTDRPQWNHGSPTWSHDGESIAYDRWPFQTDASGASLFVARVDGSGARELCDGGMPCWAPDDQQIAFHSFAPNGMSIEVIDRNGEGREKLQFAAGSPRWSPDGRTLAFVDVRHRNIGLLDTVLSRSRLILPAGWSPDHGLSWSPDGAMICFRLSGYRNEPYAIVMARTDTGEPKVRCKGWFGPHVCWSPDGKEILASRRETDMSPYQLVVIPADSDAEPLAIEGQANHANNVDASISPDGRQIIYASY